MTYPASPGDVGTNRVRSDSGQFWAGAAATAVVAALIALAGILVCRWIFNIPILAPAGDGAWGNAHTAEYALVAAIIAVLAGGLLYLLVLGTPQPNMFFDWIMGLVALVAVVYPFSTSAPVDQKAATAVVNLVLGIAIVSLLTATAARAVGRPLPLPPRPRPRYEDLGAGYVPGQRYGSQQGQGYRDEYPPDATRTRPIRPVNVPQDRDPHRWD